MNNEKDKELDDLFRKKLADPVDQIRYDENDWDALETMMDKRKRRKGIVYLLPILGSIAALLLLFLGLWFFWPKTGPVKNSNKLQSAVVHPATIHPVLKDSGKITPENQQPIAPVNKNLAAQHTNAGKLLNIAQNTPATNPTHSPNNTDTVLNGEFKKALLTGNKKPVTRDKTGLQSISSNNIEKIIHKELNSSNNGVIARQNPPLQPGSINEQKPLVNPLTSISIAGNQIADNTLHVPVLQKNNAASIAAQTDQPASEAAPKNVTAVSPQLTTAQKMDLLLQKTSDINTAKLSKQTQASLRGRYTIGVIGAQDVSGAGSFQQSKLGSKGGVMVTAALLGRFTLSTGSVYSVTPYTATYSNYHFPYQFKTEPQNITANCDMLDIPLNIGYQVLNSRHNSISVGTGLSTYVMLQQNFTVDYANSAPVNFSVSNNQSYLFKIVNINATYERQISSKAGISVQPYVKLPLADVGYSQVKLQTMGVAVGLSWNLSSQKK